MSVATGRYFERKAVTYLEHKGHTIIKKNFFTPYGEIDIISEFENKIYFFEIKYLSKASLINPIQKIDRSKIRRIYLSISYLKKYCKIKSYQVDSLCMFFKSKSLIFEVYQDLRLA